MKLSSTKWNAFYGDDASAKHVISRKGWWTCRFGHAVEEEEAI